MMGSFKNFIFTLTLYLLQGATASLIQLNNNGYENIVIAIDPTLPEDDKLIQHIKDMVKEASTYLYEATERRFYFKDVSILIPKTWQTKPNYEKPKLETHKNADILIEVPNPPGNDVPRTDQIGQCGDKGERIHLTPDIVSGKKEKEYGLPGIMVTKFGGLMDHQEKQYRGRRETN
uniref:Calcium-activated chloride channel N-terminal domain-containing protein n=1 Tax=Vombatus ursinus TaxID=29139 RepID=A0A4X2KL76_VOMUR